jgi:molybdopterin/thiamine biosynthesis adenylyltransferase/proteasome lid subunit RPN8/RPN11
MDKKAIVYMPESCYNRMIEHIFIQPKYECGGFLIGNRLELEDVFLFSLREIYYEPRVGSHSRFELTLDYTSNAQDFEERWQEEHGCDDYLVGTYHSHGTFDAFHSSVDDVYAKKFNLMIICSPSTRRVEVWYWHLGLSRWFEGELIVYSDPEEIPPKKRLICEESTLRVGMEQFPCRSYRRKSKASVARKRVCVVGGGTLGNLLAQHFVDSSPDAELTFVDRDLYGVENLPRSPMIDREAVGRPKAFALAEAVARESRNRYPVHGILADVRKLTLDFFEPFDVIVTPLDNLECRYYVSYCAAVLRKPLVNLGTSYTGLNGIPTFSGDVFYKPARSSACLDCFYPLYKSNEALLRKRVSCGGELPEEVSPQVISSSMLVASLAFVCIRKALARDKSTVSRGYNVSDVYTSEGFFDHAPVRAGGCCSFSSLHAMGTPIKIVRVSPRTHMKTLYKCVKRALGDEEDTCYELDMMDSCLPHVKYRGANPIHSILLDSESVGRLCQLMGDEYFPRDHVYAVLSNGATRYVRIKIK